MWLSLLLFHRLFPLECIYERYFFDEEWKFIFSWDAVRNQIHTENVYNRLIQKNIKSSCK